MTKILFAIAMGSDALLGFFLYFTGDTAKAIFWLLALIVMIKLWELVNK